MLTEIIDLTPGGRIDTFTSPTLTVECANDGTASVVVDHVNTRVYLELRAEPEGEVLLTIDDSLRQEMLYIEGMREPAPPVTVGAGSKERIEFDLASYCYPFREGVYTLTPCFDSPATGPGAGKPVGLEVVARGAAQIQEWFENPVFGTDSLLCRTAEEDGGSRSYLRWLGLNRPLASFYNRDVASAPADWTVVPARPAYFQLEDLEPGFEKVLVAQGPAGELRVNRTMDGDAYGAPISCRLPHAAPLIPGAFRMPDDEVFVFTRAGEGEKTRVRGYMITPDGRVLQRLEHVFEDEPDALLSVAGGPDLIHLLRAGSAIEHLMFSHRGGKVSEGVIGRYGGAPLVLEADLAADSIKAVYLDEEDRRRVVLVESSFPSLGGSADEPRVERILLAVPKGDALREIDFLHDAMDRLNVLYSTARERLVHYRAATGTSTLARADDAFHPRLLPGQSPGLPGSPLPYVGFFLRSRGYRFYEPIGSPPWQHVQTMRW